MVDKNLLDKTESKDADEIIEKMHVDLELTFNAIPDFITVIDKDHCIRQVNDSFLKQVSLPREQVIGKKCYTIMHCLNEPPSWCPYLLTIADGKEHNVEMTEPRLDGTFLVSTTPITDGYGNKGAVHVVRDITQQKKAEARLEMVNEKLRVVGKLTRHDVGNKLMIIVYSAYLLRKRFGGVPEIAAYLQNIDSAVAMAIRIFDFSRTYEKIGSEQQKDINIKECFQDALALFPNIGNIKIINETEGLIISADSLLQQLFYNLIDNTIKHGKTVTEIKLHYQTQPGKVTLYYEDNGIGVKDEDKYNIFSEGFTTNGGAGLGLSMIKKMIEVYNWTIKETGIPGKGVRFDINIPIDAT